MHNSLLALKLITQQAAEIATLHGLIDFLVVKIKETMSVSSCSLYLMDEHRQLVLVATEGLDKDAINKVKLRPGQGLVGTIAESLHPMNLDVASKHPAYRYFKKTQEERFNGFMGTPLVHLRKTLGVLIVQKPEATKFSDEEEAFLVTVGAQLAGIVHRFEWLESEDLQAGKSGQNKKFSGVKGAPGIGIGHIEWVDEDLLKQVADQTCVDPDAEIKRFEAALLEAKQQIIESNESLSTSLPGDVRALLNVYTQLMDSPELISGVVSKIKAGNWAEGALRATIHEYAMAFSVIPDPYLQAREEDIHHMGKKIYSALQQHQPGHKHEATSPVILVGDLVGITDIARFPLDMLAGVVCTRGSALSHTAVLANALGIPAVMGIGEIRDIPDNTPAVVDGHLGYLILNPSQRLQDEYQSNLNEELEFDELLGELSTEEAITTDGDTIVLLANTGLLADISPGLTHGAAGIGLYRSEMPFLTHDTFPTEDEQYEVYRHVLSSYQHRPVYMRTLDIGGDKPLPYFEVEEDNPSLGWRGIRFTLDNPAIFMAQLRAMLRASLGIGNLNILIPMVSRVDEVVSFKAMLDDAIGQLKDEGIQVKTPPVGVMIEVPAAVTLLEFIRPHIDFVSIGTNDLTQYLLAADRGNSRVSGIVDNLHPAVIHELYDIALRAGKMSLPVSICGEMASDPLAVPLLLGMGFNTLSMSVHNLPRIKWLIRHISSESARRLLKDVLAVDNERDIKVMVRQMLSEFELDRLLPGHAQTDG
jgi:phosphotransferase system enzyme I (PtsI)/phosphotransferase system enzyme I (PtsP)